MSESLVESVIISTRPSFLVLTSICLLLGVAAAGHGSRVTGSATDSEFVITAVLILISALAAHVSVYTFNEYFDFRSGLDESTTRTSFSGGSGSLVAAPGAARYVLKEAITNLLSLNQYPGIEANASVGRKHYPISWVTPLVLALTVLFA